MLVFNNLIILQDDNIHTKIDKLKNDYRRCTNRIKTAQSDVQISQTKQNSTTTTNQLQKTYVQNSIKCY